MYIYIVVVWHDNDVVLTKTLLVILGLLVLLLLACLACWWRRRSHIDFLNDSKGNDHVFSVLLLTRRMIPHNQLLKKKELIRSHCNQACCWSLSTFDTGFRQRHCSKLFAKFNIICVVVCQLSMKALSTHNSRSNMRSECCLAT